MVMVMVIVASFLCRRDALMTKACQGEIEETLLQQVEWKLDIKKAQWEVSDPIKVKLVMLQISGMLYLAVSINTFRSKPIKASTESSLLPLSCSKHVHVVCAEYGESAHLHLRTTIKLICILPSYVFQSDQSPLRASRMHAFNGLGQQPSFLLTTTD